MRCPEVGNALIDINKVMDNRTKSGTLYTKLINKNTNLITPTILTKNKSVYAQYTLLVENRDKLKDKLKECDIPAAIYYPKCLHEQEVYKYLGYEWGDFPNAEKASRQVLSLPIHGWITEDNVNTVVNEGSPGEGKFGSTSIT